MDGATAIPITSEGPTATLSTRIRHCLRTSRPQSPGASGSVLTWHRQRLAPQLAPPSRPEAPGGQSQADPSHAGQVALRRQRRWGSKWPGKLLEDLRSSIFDPRYKLHARKPQPLAFEALKASYEAVAPPWRPSAARRGPAAARSPRARRPQALRASGRQHTAALAPGLGWTTSRSKRMATPWHRPSVRRARPSQLFVSDKPIVMPLRRHRRVRHSAPVAGTLVLEGLRGSSWPLNSCKGTWSGRTDGGRHGFKHEN